MDAYDELAYDSLCIPETHPARLSAVAYLFGMDPPEPTRSRVLELGCASGGNLIPMAVQLPRGHFVGVDLSPTQIATGRQLIRTLGLANIELRVGNVLDLDERLGQFDYIIAHGLYSWVPDAVRERLLGLIRSLLAPGGIAYVSYNCLPGWRMRGMLRDILLDAAGDGDAQNRVEAARAALKRLAAGLDRLPGVAAEYLRDEIPRLAEAPDSYLLHEFLAPHNHACLFRDFVTEADRAGLRYLADSRLHTLFPSSLGEHVEAALADIDDGIELEQWLDFLSNRRFRQSLLFRNDLSFDEGLSLERFAGWCFGADLTVPSPLVIGHDGPVLFRRRDGEEIPVEHALSKALLADLTRRYPRTLPLRKLLPDVQQRVTEEAGAALAADIDGCLMELFELFCRDVLVATSRPRGVAEIGSRPEAAPLASALAATGIMQLPTIDHQNLELDDVAARLLGLLDGNRDIAALTRTINEDLVAGRLEPPRSHSSRQMPQDGIEQAVRRLVGLFQRYGLLHPETTTNRSDDATPS